MCLVAYRFNSESVNSTKVN